MINISRNIDNEQWTLKVTLEGHANKDEYGKDIVCAAISSLTYTLAQYVMKRTGTNLSSEIKLNSGDADIWCKCKTMAEFNKMAQAYEIICIGYEMIAEAHPNHVILISW